MREKPTFAEVLIAARKGSDREFYEVLKAYGEPEASGNASRKALDPATRRALIGLVILFLAPLVSIWIAVYLAL